MGIILLDAGVLFGHTKIPSPLGSQFDANTSLQSYQFLFGPEVAYRNRKVQLFGHGLFGGWPVLRQRGAKRERDRGEKLVAALIHN